MKSSYYILKDKVPIHVDDVQEWAKAFGDRDARQVRRTHLFGEWIYISTVFLGLDHQWGGGPPLLFETMIFGGHLSEAQWRYSTWKEAVRGHYTAVFLAIISIPLILFKKNEV